MPGEDAQYCPFRDRDLRENWEERVAIMIDGGLSPEDARTQATELIRSEIERSRRLRGERD